MEMRGMDRVQNRLSDIISRMEELQIGSNQPNPAIRTDPPQNPEQRESLSKRGADDDFSSMLDRLIQEKAKKFNVSDRLVRAVIEAESGGRQSAVSQDGAVGLMQLMPATARELGVNPELPEENIEGGIRYLRDMSSRFQTLDEVLAAYNAGPGAVKKYGGIPPYRETKNYIDRVKRHLKEYGPE
jgi:soluble lytic murein transglycosylase-like protein